MGLALLSLARRGPRPGGRRRPGPGPRRPRGPRRPPRAPRHLRGELERAGLISAEVLERLACDADLIVALDDEAGHTMYEGRVLRFPSDTQRRELWRRDRHCRFPGCSHDTYTNVHHIEAWSPSGRTDLDNLVTLCRHHHHEIHSKRWSMRGDANVELTFVASERHHHDLAPLAAVAQRRRARMRVHGSETHDGRDLKDRGAVDLREPRGPRRPRGPGDQSITPPPGAAPGASAASSRRGTTTGRGATRARR